MTREEALALYVDAGIAGVEAYLALIRAGVAFDAAVRFPVGDDDA